MKKLRRFDPGQEGMRAGDVWIDAWSRDDIPKLVGGLRDVSLKVELRESEFRLLEERIGGGGGGGSQSEVVAIAMLSVRGCPCGRFSCLAC